jgi:SAM-dependent methyltransferase
MFRVVQKKTLAEISTEWDAIASTRYHQIKSGADISYNSIIAPTLISLAAKYRPKRILDAGCGIGFFTDRLSALSNDVTGVDPSKHSIELARAVAPNAKLIHSSLEQFALESSRKFDLITANMVLMDVLQLPFFLKGCSTLLEKGGHLVFSITHPWFWPEYYGFSEQSWFQYESELIIESPFRISSDQAGSEISTQVHRSLSIYIASLQTAGFLLAELLEPVPPKDTDPIYLSRWKNPRYLFCAARSVDD